ncbi:MAG TPA: FtsX-like permease family protein, partial [Azospirillaceae bacterium]|nr:FtsX-like permease family protein [Azospirillaceae bacterium]
GIGIRRVVGASAPQVALLLVGQFTRPVLLANLVAWPAAWWLLSRWLEQYAVRIEMTPLPFLAAGLGALALAALVVLVHALRVAAAPPVAALRHE